MDPILSSTVDFDNYINDVLNIKSSNGVRPSSSSRRKTPSASETRTSAKMMEANAKKFMSDKRAGPNKSERKEITNNNYLDSLNLTHSWKGHVSSTLSRRYTDDSGDDEQPPSRGHQGVDSVRHGIASLSINMPVPSRASGRRTADDELDESCPMPNPPLAYTKQPHAHSSSTSPQRAGKATRGAAVPSSMSLSASLDDQLFSRFKSNSVLLSRCFRSWQAAASLSKSVLLTRAKVVMKMKREGVWLLRYVLLEWRGLHRAARFSVKFTRYMAKKLLRRWKQRVQRRRRLMRRAVWHHEHRLVLAALLLMYRNMQRGKRTRRKRGTAAGAEDLRRRHLLLMVLNGWKRVQKKASGEKHIIEEQLRRREKIQQFVSKIGAVRSAHSGTGAEIAEAKAAMAEESKWNSRTALSGPAAGKADRGRTAAEAKSTGRGIIGLPPRPNSVSAHQALNKLLHSAPAAAAATASSAPATASARVAPLPLEGDYSEDPFEAYDSDSSGEDPRPAPPSFNTLMREGRDAFDVHPTTSAPSPARTGGQPSPNTAAKGGALTPRGAQQSPRPLASAAAPSSSSGKAKPVSSDFERRAAERRENLIALRKASELRVTQRRKELEAKESERLAKEAEEAERIRRNSKLKIAEKKQNAVQSAASVEHAKKLMQWAANFNRMRLIIQFGFGPWRRFMDQVRIDLAKAAQFHNDRLLHATWSALVGYIVMVRAERYRREHRQTGMAVAKYRRGLLLLAWKQWRLLHKMIRAKARAVTGHFSRFTLFRRAFNGWKVAYERSLRYTAKRMAQVAPMGRRKALRYYWSSWRQYHENQLFDREVRYRTDDKWAKIQSWMNKK